MAARRGETVTGSWTSAEGATQPRLRHGTRNGPKRLWNESRFQR